MGKPVSFVLSSAYIWSNSDRILFYTLYISIRGAFRPANIGYMKLHEVASLHPILNKPLPSFPGIPGIPLKDGPLRAREAWHSGLTCSEDMWPAMDRSA